MSLSRVPRKPVGRRAAALLLLSAVWVFIGVSVLLDHDAAIDHVRFFHVEIGHHVRAAGWIIPGLFGIVAAAVGRHRLEGRGFAALAVPVLIRGVSGLYGWLIYLLPLPQHGNPSGWLDAGVWGAAFTLILLLTGWPDDIRRKDEAR